MLHAHQPTAAPSDIRSSRAAFVFGERSARSVSGFTGNAEPSLDEVIDDPMVRRLMDRDGVRVDSLIGLIEEVRERI